MNQTEKDQFDSLMKIAEFNINQFNERREYSWKITFGFWGAIIGSIATIAPYRTNIPTWSIILFAHLVIFLHLHWLYGTFVADKRDKKLAFDARNEAINLLKDKKVMAPVNDDRKFLNDWSAQFQLVVTIILAVMATAIFLLPSV